MLTLSAVIFAFSGSVLLGNYFLDMFVGLRESTIRSQTGHIQIQKNGYKTYGGSAPTEYLILNYEEILEEVYVDQCKNYRRKCKHTPSFISQYISQ
jgi:putative ABC transport system permease protein